MDLERVTFPGFVAHTATKSIQGESGFALALPSIRFHVGFIAGLAHCALRWTASMPCPVSPHLVQPYPSQPCMAPSRHAANWSPVSGGNSLPCLALPSLIRSGPAYPRRASTRPSETSRASSRLAQPRLAAPCDWSPVSGDGSAPRRAMLRQASPRHALPVPASPDQARPCRALEKKSACLLAGGSRLLKDTTGMANRQADACDRHKNNPFMCPSAKTVYHRLEQLSRCKILHR